MPEPFRPDDELVSAVLDGEATADERARVAADPALAARLAEFTAVADAMRAPVSPAAAARDASIATAVAEARPAEKVVVALRPRRANGSFLAVAAAVLVVLLFAGFLVGQVGDRGTEDSASSSDDSAGSDGAESAGDSGASTADEETAAADQTDGDTSADSPPIELGDVADEAALRAALVASGELDAFDASPTTRTTLPPTTTAEATVAVPGDSQACEVRLEEADPALSGRLLKGTATYAGTPAVVYIFATVDGDTRVEVVTTATCATLVSFPL